MIVAITDGRANISLKRSTDPEATASDAPRPSSQELKVNNENHSVCLVYQYQCTLLTGCELSSQWDDLLFYLIVFSRDSYFELEHTCSTNAWSPIQIRFGMLRFEDIPRNLISEQIDIVTSFCLMKDEILEVAGKIYKAGMSLLVIDTENKFVSTGFAKEIARVAQGVFVCFEYCWFFWIHMQLTQKKISFLQENITTCQMRQMLLFQLRPRMLYQHWRILDFCPSSIFYFLTFLFGINKILW